MALPHLHILHPARSRAPHLTEWLAEVEDVLRSDPIWDSCRLHRTECNVQAGFDVPTFYDRVMRTMGPIIVIEKVQAPLLERLKQMVGRRISVYPIEPQCSEDIWQQCEVARMGFEDGEPRIPQRELIAFLIVRKLERLKRWGGTSLNKNFLWAHDLPNGGFPKDECTPREILDVADALVNAGVLSPYSKVSKGETKYALGPPETVARILESKAFAGHRKLQKYFDRSRKYVPANLLDYDE